ncbi:MAG: hypothetical protein IIU85_05105 [Rikenellaceae bacterium]|nr:hypothetical protein [Rikenellaceae bacterium]
MTTVFIILLTVALVIATKLFFDWTNKYGDEWNWVKIKEGYTKGWPTLLIFTLLFCAAIAIVYYLLPAPKSAFLAFYEMWGLWVPTWGIVGGFAALRSLIKIFRETRRANKSWIAFVVGGALLFIGSMIWYGFEVAKIINTIA